jgi:hypothetical protein
MKTTGYTTNYAVYYNFGSVFSGELSAETIAALKRKMTEFAANQNAQHNVEIVTFQPIIRITTSKAKRGFYVQFSPKITNRYFGKNTKPTEYYDKL